MNTREAVLDSMIQDAVILPDSGGLGRLARRSGGGAAAVVLAALAVHAHRRAGARTVTVGLRTGMAVLPVEVNVSSYSDFETLTKRVGARLRRARRTPAAAPQEQPTLVAAAQDSGWRVELPESEQPGLVRLFTELTARPSQPVGRADLIGPDEYEELIHRYNATAHDIDAAATITSGFEAVVARTPEATALVCGEESLTYAELDARADRLARVLIDHGVRRESVVGLAMARSVEAIVAVYAVLKAGGAYLPLDPGHPAERTARMLTVARPRCVLTTRRDGFTHQDTLVLHVEELAADDSRSTDSLPSSAEYDGPPRPDNLAYLLFTSGSTGTPKGVGVTHAALVNHLAWMTEHHGLDHTDAVLQKTPTTFDVSIWELLWPLQIGARLVIAPTEANTDPELVARLIAEQGVTTVQFVPALLSSHLNAATLPPGLRRVLMIGETLTPQLAHRFAAACPARLHNLYGPTEATGAVTGHRVPAGLPSRIPIGTPGWNTRVYVLDAGLRPVPRGVAGELYLAGPQLARGYHGDPARTAAQFVTDPFERGARMYRTGDIVRWDPAAEVLDYIGRADFQIKRHGVRIEPGEIEAVLADCAAVAQAVVVQRGDGRLAAYVVAVTGRACTESVLREQLSHRLPAAMLPDDIVVLAALPTTSAGKVDRAALPAPAAPATPYRAPSGAIEETIAAVYAEVLGRDRIGAEESFFALGGDSVMSILLVSRAKSRGVWFTAQQVFEQRTVAGLARIATTGAETPAAPAELPGGGVGELPVTPAIGFGLWLAESGAGGFDRFAQPMVLTLPVGVDRTGLSAVLAAVLERHDMLRARLYRDASGQWRLFADPASVVDLDALLERIEFPATADDRALADLTAAAVDTAFDGLAPAEGRVVRCVWLEPDRPDRAGRLVLAIHHIAVDGVSWRILIPDFLTAWAQYTDGRRPALPAAGTSMRRWTHTLHEQAHHASRIAELPRWREILDGPDPLLGDRRLDPMVDIAARVRRVRIESDRETTAAVLSMLPERYHTSANVVLLTALALAVTRWRAQLGRPSASTLVRLESHGREADLAPGADLSHTVGWFTAIFPCRFDLSDIDVDAAFTGGAPLDAALKTVKEQLVSVPGSGIGYGLLRYMNSETARSLPAEPGQIAFTYLGAVSAAHDTAWLPATDPTATPHPGDPHLPAAAAVSIDALVVDGQLSTGFSAPDTLLDAPAVGALTELWAEALTALAAHSRDRAAGGRTPSDFPLVTPSQRDIDRWEATYPGLVDIWSLTPIQEKFARYALAHADDIDVHTTHLRLAGTGTLDAARLRAAARAVVDRHPGLRAAFETDSSGGLCQLVTVPVAIDWRELDRRDDESGLDALLHDELIRPFDLTAAPLIRFLLIRVVEGWRFVVTSHRLLIDGWSVPVLIGDLWSAYTGEAVRPVAGSYRTFLEWRARQDRDAAATAWRDALAGVGPAALLAAPGAVPADPATPPVEHRLRLSEQDTRGLSRLATDAGVTVNTVLQCAWALVLGRLTGRRDVVFGTVVSGRPAEVPGVEAMVGSFINTVPVRVRWEDRAAVRALLTGHQDAQAALVDHQYLGLAEIEESTGVAVRELFDTLLVFESYPADYENLLAAAEFDGMAITGFESEEITLFPLTVTAWPGTRLHLRIDRHRDLVGDSLIQQVITELHDVLGMLARGETFER
ncbi:non-ribosomal peptide synthetase [Nocardia cyriacigeorgica]|uniref:non-ribosomal peptide synthetase n=1 Tax=Nocardia cyriacigeorgica TaxID=135487 RepID=UPI002453A219|nr:non-ribosomal peptide synthetase [Nocardia cyriacigeorgica]